MEVSINSIVEVLNGVESNLKKALKETASSPYALSPKVNFLAGALEDTQSAITKLIKIG